MPLPHFSGNYNNLIEPIYNSITEMYFSKLPNEMVNCNSMDDKFFNFNFNVIDSTYEPLKDIMNIVENEIIQDVFITFKNKNKKIYRYKFENLKFLKIEDFFNIDYNVSNEIKDIKVKYDFENLFYFKYPLNKKEERMVKLKFLTQNEKDFYQKISKDVFF